MAERVFVEKLHRVGFADIEVVDRVPMGVGDCEITPVFTADLIELMRRVIPPEMQDRVATGIVVIARKPG